MRTDLIGAEEIVAKVDALAAQQSVAQRARIDALEAARTALTADIDAGAEHLRSGSKMPALTEPKAQKVADDAERALRIVTLALQREREAFEADVYTRHDELAVSLATLEDEGDVEITRLLDVLDSLLAERAAIKAHRTWIDDPSRNLGNVRAITADSLRKQINAEPGTASSRQQEKLDHERQVEAWNALTTRACANLDRDNMADTVEVRGEEIDALIECEIERLIEAGEPVPKPPVLKWAKKLGVGRFAGTSHLRPEFAEATRYAEESTDGN